MKLNPVNSANTNLEAQDCSKRELDKLKNACKDFEALFLNYMFKTMRSSLSGDSVFGKSFGKDIYESMYFQELSSSMARGKGTGLSDMLFEQLNNKYIK